MDVSSADFRGHELNQIPDEPPRPDNNSLAHIGGQEETESTMDHTKYEFVGGKCNSPMVSDDEQNKNESHDPTSAVNNYNDVRRDDDSIGDNNNDDNEDVDGVMQTGAKGQAISMIYLAVIILTPIVLLPIILVIDDQYRNEARCGYVISIMAVYWTTEVIPIAITALLPVVLFPMLGVMTARETSGAYFNDTSMLFVGGLLVAIAIEVWDVHKRVALLTVRVVGAEPKSLLLGITLVTWFLSMWISNTATTAMMMTMVQALLDQYKEVYKQRDAHLHRQPLSRGQRHRSEMSKASEKEYLNLCKAVSLTVAYAANIGGIGSLTGTGPNLIFYSAAQRGSWPCSCCKKGEGLSQDVERVNAVIRQEYKKMGPVRSAQKTIMISFIVLVFCWITRDLGGTGGWGVWFPRRMVTDSTPSILFGVLMFVLPSAMPRICGRGGRHGRYVKIRPLLTWKNVHEKMPWTLYLVLGGGYALARASSESGLSEWLGEQLLVFKGMNTWLILLIICYVVAFATEVTSNSATATLMMPILSQMAISLQVNPLFFMYPAAIATSFAFMLPAATPPNAIVFSRGIVRVIDMVSCGIVLNIVTVPILVMASSTWGNALFHFDTIQPEFLRNTTTVA